MVDRMSDCQLVMELKESVSYIRTCFLPVDEVVRQLGEYKNTAGQLIYLFIAPKKS
jgi:hypothetical protein